MVVSSENDGTRHDNFEGIVRQRPTLVTSQLESLLRPLLDRQLCDINLIVGDLFDDTSHLETYFRAWKTL